MKKKFSTDVVCVWCIRHIFAVHCLKPREFINSQVAAKEGSYHISQAGVPVPWLGDVVGQSLSSLVFGWLWRKGDLFKLKGCSCFPPDSVCYLINLLNTIAVSVSHCADRGGGRWELVLHTSRGDPVPHHWSHWHSTNFKEKGQDPQLWERRWVATFYPQQSKAVAQIPLALQGTSLGVCIFGHICLSRALLDRLQQWAWAPVKQVSFRMLIPLFPIRQGRQIKT